VARALSAAREQKEAGSLASTLPATLSLCTLVSTPMSSGSVASLFLPVWGGCRRGVRMESWSLAEHLTPL
jgi:hypothetical protein